jgi:hypothetical protein
VEAEISVFQRPWKLLSSVQQTCPEAALFQELKAVKVLEHFFHDLNVVEAGTHVGERSVNDDIGQKGQA